MINPNESEGVAPLAEQIVEKILKEGDDSLYRYLVSIDYRWEPVDIDTFLTDSYYLGEVGKYIYPKWREVLREVFNPVSRYKELIITGAVGTGKTTCASVSLVYVLYQLSCLRDPAVFLGLMPGSPIVLGIYNIFRYKADDCYMIVKNMVENCPYFRERFPTRKMENFRARDGLYFPNQIYVVSGSTELHAIGLNLFSLLVDEMNFMRVSNSSRPDITQAQRLYVATKRRLESRYMYKGKIPGLMILLSSRNVETSWLEEHIAQVSSDPEVYVADFPIWEVKKDVLGLSGEKFRVLVGTNIYQSRVLEQGEEVPPGGRVVEVPMEYYDSFVSDVDGALRDLAGVATVPHGVFVRDREKVMKCVDSTRTHPFVREVISISDRDQVKIQDFLREKDLIKVNLSVASPKINPNAPRHVHVDLAEKGDSVGISMGHVSKVEGVSSWIVIDLMLRITPPRAGSIDFSKIRDFIVHLRDHLGFPIKKVTFDSYQSADSRQILGRLGFDVGVVSVDRDDKVYSVARSVFYEGRVSTYYYKPFFDEFFQLIFDAEKRKVDHPPGGSKDCSDAVASVIFTLQERVSAGKRGSADLVPFLVSFEEVGRGV